MFKSKEYYKKIIKEKPNYKNYLINFFQSYLFGGIICLLCTLLYRLLLNYFAEDNAKLLVSMCLILITGILTAIGIYDKIGQKAKCGLAILISGFSNACISSAMEYRKEGLILGIASNCLKLAGAVIVLGSTCAFFVALARYIWWLI